MVISILASTQGRRPLKEQLPYAAHKREGKAV